MITLSLLHPLNKNPLQHWTFEKESVVRIGRSTDNDVILYSAVVSRHHVELKRSDQGWEITSLGTNGTYLEGKRITQVPVEDGIVIRLARSGPNIQIRLGADSHEAIKSNLLNRSAAAPSAGEQTPSVTNPSEDTLGKPGKQTPNRTTSGTLSGIPYSSNYYP
ncbi:MAG: FHA domain-containing protein [Leptolyngbyaceae cyanobacterium SM1_1_3]|nr:FHA domain-containing protein [Leptolyngbyaceae cyanobacterium SM1_1_3]NJN01890.1 FHA domain-containing protein [Leptolyngbyaceae cyanobacterium RM1_1_2]NJO09672.1 FHA domain-containing protein [Leptolyngbyaceae cyanobacterium SL_1_1]